jgi:hypothetical protein
MPGRLMMKQIFNLLKKEPLIFRIIFKTYRLFVYNFGSVLLFLLILALE